VLSHGATRAQCLLSCTCTHNNTTRTAERQHVHTRPVSPTAHPSTRLTRRAICCRPSCWCTCLGRSAWHGADNTTHRRTHTPHHLTSPHIATRSHASHTPSPQASSPTAQPGTQWRSSRPRFHTHHTRART
jgi:hypothetical protein